MIGIGFDEQAVPAARRAGGHTMADPSMLLPGYNTATGQYCFKASQLHAPELTLSHTGNGGMTSSLSIGTSGPAAARRLMQFPLSPILTTGRSQLQPSSKLEDPRFHNVNISRQELQMLAASGSDLHSPPFLR